MKEPHHRKQVGIGMIMVAASLAMIGILQLAIGPDVLFADDIQRQQVEVFDNCKANGCLLYTSPSPRDRG